MAKRKPTAPKRDPATLYRTRLEANKAALGAQQARWSPNLQNRLELFSARLLYAATAPTNKTRGLRKRLLERFFRAETRHPAHRKALYRSAKAVLGAAASKNPVAFERTRAELRGVRERARRATPPRKGKR